MSILGKQNAWKFHLVFYPLRLSVNYQLASWPQLPLWQHRPVNSSSWDDPVRGSDMLPPLTLTCVKW